MRGTELFRTRRTRSGFTLIELLVVVAIIALLIAILLPSLARARELSKRTVCSANMSGIGKGLFTYANENDDDMPAAEHLTLRPSDSTQVLDQPGECFTRYTGVMGAENNNSATSPVGPGRGFLQYDPGGDPSDYKSTDFNRTYPWGTLSNSRNLWMLIRMAASTPEAFYCPSSDDKPNNEDNPAAYWDFGIGDEAQSFPPSASSVVTGTPINWQGNHNPSDAYKQLSYGYQVPYGLYGRPTIVRHQKMPLAADKGPWSADLEGAGESPSVTDLHAPELESASSAEQWQKYNSPNHGGALNGEGQNVLYADSHVNFEARCTVGVGNDNIYTAWGAPENLIVPPVGTNSAWQQIFGSVPTFVTNGPDGGISEQLFFNRMKGRIPGYDPMNITTKKSSYTEGDQTLGPMSDTDSLIYP